MQIQEINTGLYPEEEYYVLLGIAIEELEKIIVNHTCDHTEGKCPCYRWRLELAHLREKYSQKEEIL